MGTLKGINTVADLEKFIGRPLDEKPAKKLGSTDAGPQSVMVDPTVGVINGRLVAIVPTVTASEANESRWVKRMRRKLSMKAAMRKTLGPHLDLLVPFADAYHSGKALRVTLTRLGGRRLDPCNLPTSMKAAEDCLEGSLLANDGDPRWMVRFEQSPGGPVGIRIELEIS